MFGSTQRRNATGSRSGRPSRVTASTAAWALITPLALPAALALQVAVAPPAAAAAALTVMKSAPASALVGESVAYVLTASNPGDAPLYNVTFRDVLPIGLKYRAGSSPQAAGEPEIITTGAAPNTQQTLIWSNVADLQPTSSFRLTFEAVPDATRLPVGAPVANTGYAYGDENPRLVPDFDANGNPVDGSYTASDADGPRTTTFTAIEVRKSEPSDEGELLRGIHRQTTTYTLEVQNNDALPTTGVTVVDYLPAALEFLHCGAVDNSAAGMTEYAGAPRLTAVPAPAGTGVCPRIGGTDTPRIDAVETVTLAADNPQGYPAGVYTRVSYALGDMAKDQTVTLKYRAGIPLRANEAFGAAPTPGSGAQAANLDNNTGPSTRETTTEASVTNRVRAEGIYTGPIVTDPTGPVIDPDGGPVADDDEVTRSIEDLALVKSVTPTEFSQGSIATYTLRMRASEYTKAGGVVVKDLLPNGVCPLVGAADVVGVVDQSSGATLGVDCLSDGLNGPSTPYTSYVINADGTTRVTFAPVAEVAADGTFTITYSARMRTLYGGTAAGTGGLAGQPIAAGDSFTNEVDLTGTTTPAVPSGESGSQGVLDDSQATLPSGGASLDKAIKPRDTSFAEVYDCDGPASIPTDWDPTTDDTPYGDAADFLAIPGFDENRLTFRKGGEVCFQITARFSENTQTRNAVITDFLPVGTSYVRNSYELVDSPVGVNTLTPGQVSFNEGAAAAGTADPTWILGTPTSGGGALTVPRGSVFQARFAVTIDRAADGTSVDVVGNLVKMRTENSKGQAQSFRDQEDFGIIPPPPVRTVKGVHEVNGVAQPAWDPTTGNDNVLVKQGDLVTYRVQLTNEGDNDTANAVAARQLDLWDVLPVGIACADVVSTGGVPDTRFDPAVDAATMRVTCYDEGKSIDTTPPADSAPTTTPPGRAVIQWKDTATDLTASGINSLFAPDQLGTPIAPPNATTTRGYYYTVKMPAELSVGAVLPNTAGVRQFGVLNNQRISAPYFPAQNIDPSISPAAFDAEPSRDDSSVRIAPPVVTKGVTSELAEKNNVGAESAPTVSTQAVPGEVVTYTVTAAVPAQTTAYNATLTDPLPAGQRLLTADAKWSASGDPAGPWSETLPVGVTLDTTGGTPVLRFPATYNNTSADPDLFRLVITARVVARDPINAQGAARVNTATFTSTPTPSGGTPTGTSASATVNVVEPAADVVKESAGDTNGIVVGGQAVSYTLTVANLPDRPTLHDSWVVDCVPTGLNNPTYTASRPAGLATLTPAPGDGTNGCVTGFTRLAWDIGDVEAGGGLIRLRYDVTVEAGATGAQQYTNTATVTGNSLPGDRPTPLDAGNPDGRTYSDTGDRTVAVAGAASRKTVDKPNATIGEIVTYTITSILPPDVNFYDVALIDSLPAGVVPQAGTPLVSTTCTNIPAGTPCSPGITPTPLTSSPSPVDPTTANVIGLGLGDLGPSSSIREVEVVYTARVVNIAANTTGRDLVNSVTTRWNLVDGTNPTTVAGPWTQSSAPRSATVNITQPSLTPTKTVSDGSVDPGQEWTYTVSVRNATGVNRSAAYDVTITDTVPSGVVVLPGSLTASGGVLTATEPDGSGGTITWTVPGPIAPGATVAFTYSARLAPSGTITAAIQTNTARVGSYYSLPSDYSEGFFPGTPRDRRQYTGSTSTAAVTPQFPALTTTKTAQNPPIAYVNTPFRWGFEVTSSGLAPAFDVDAADTLPPNWRYLGGSARISVAGGVAAQVEPTQSVAGDTQTLTWTDVGDLPVGTKVVATYQAFPLDDALVTPGAGSGIAHTNTVSAAADDATGAPGNATGPYVSNEATAVARIHAADLVMDKNAGTFSAGATGIFTLDVRNAGPDTAVGPFTVTDPLPGTPAGLSFVSAAGTGWSCSVAPVDGTPGEVTCTRTDANEALASGASFPRITITVEVGADVPDGTRYANTAEVSGRTHDPRPENNADSATATVIARADLAITKRLTGSAVAGRDATYTIDVTNLGPAVSRADITVRDTLPPGATFRSATGEGWTCTEGSGAGTVTCVRGTELQVGAAAPSITVVVGIPSAQTAAVVNTATVTGTTTDPVTGNNATTVTTPVTRSADLAIEKRHVRTFVAGDSGTYEFQVLNFGPSDADAPVTITDTLPDGLTYDSVTPTAGGWGCTAEGQLLTCTRGGSSPSAMPARTDETLSVIVDIDPALQIGSLENTATVASPTTDPVPDNNTDSDLLDSDTLADLAITKTVAAPEVTAGEQVTYTLAVSNNGPSVARQPIRVTDEIPAGLSWPGAGSASGDGWACDVADRTITCTRTTDLAEESDAPPITVVLDVDPDAGPATIVNAANVDGPTNDPDLSNNSDEIPVTVVDAANVRLAKDRIGTDPVTAGTQVRFTLAVTNDGPSDADSVAVADTLDPGLLPLAASGDGWNCVFAGLLVTCTRPTVFADPTGNPAPAPVITITALVQSFVPDGTTLVNSATVTTSAPGDDDDEADNTDSAEVPVVAIADLTLEKSVGDLPADTPILAGESVPFMIEVSNAGDSDAIAPVRVVDTLPAGFTFSGQSTPGWDCAATSGAPATGDVVTCILGEPGAPVGLFAGASTPTIVLTAGIDPTVTAGTYTNDAQVSTPTAEELTDNNEDSAEVTVGELADVSVTKAHTGEARVGDPLTFTLLVVNAGPSVARSVFVTDTMPPGLVLESAVGDGWTCQITSADLTCRLEGALDPAAEAPEITVVTRVQPSAYPTVTNEASVSSRTPDPDQANNTAEDTVSVPALVDLAVTKTHTGEFQVGDQGIWTVAVTNNGPTPAPKVVVTDTLPPGVRYVSATGSGVQCAASGQVVTCALDQPLPVAASVVVTVRVDVLPAATPGVTNVVSVSSPSEETVSANNSATDPVTVLPLVALDIVKDVIDQTEEQATFRITVTNGGPNATVTPIVVSDVLPTGLAFVSAGGTGWVCTGDAAVVCRHDGPLAVGASAGFDVVTDITSPPDRTLTNVATITAGCAPGPVIPLAGLAAAEAPTGCASDDAEVVIPDDPDVVGGEGAGEGDSAAGTPDLPDTGSDSAGLLAVACALLLGGGGAVALARRRRE